MGRGQGAAEHDENSKVAAVDDPMAMLDRTKREYDDSDDEDEQAADMPEKAIEQIKQEEEMEWKRFHYPEWINKVYMIYIIFLLALINQIFTLTHWHGTHSWRRPIDLLPANLRPGGWQHDEWRFAGAILGLISACFSFVLSPSSSKFKFMFMIMFVAGVMHSVAFGVDLNALMDAVDIPFCKDAVPDMEARRFSCRYGRFRATVIFDTLCAVASFATGFLIFYQATQGVVTRRKVFNEQTKTWEKIVLGPEDEYWMAFPPAFKKQRPLFVFAVVSTAVLNIVSITLSITQQTLDIYMPTATYNVGRTTPVDIYIYEGAEGIPFGLGTGSWPEINFGIRLAVNMLVLVAAAFLIQWRRDGRVMQLYVMGAILIGSGGYVAAMAMDYNVYTESEKYCDYAAANNMVCDQQPYLVVLVLDWILLVFTFLFGASSFKAWFQQARVSTAPYEGAPAGWFCFGGENSENAIEKRRLAAEARPGQE